MSDRKRVQAAQANGAWQVEDCDIPDGMTIGEWRKSVAAERRKAAKRDRITARAKLLLGRRRG